MTIEIHNLRKEKPSEPWDVRVDRGNIGAEGQNVLPAIGNPFPMKGDESKRDEVCDNYRNWLESKVKNGDPQVMQAMDELKAIYDKYGKLRLFCWCAPARCHCASVRDYLIHGPEFRKFDETPTEAYLNPKEEPLYDDTQAPQPEPEPEPQPQPQPAQEPQEIVPGPVVREFSELQVSPELKAALAENLPYGYMFEAQAEAVAKVIDGSNVVASIPTAGGKSVIGYIALFNRLLSQGEKGMYIVPFKALAEEKKEEIENLGKRLGIKVCVMTGDHKDKTPVPPDTDILLATAEKADSLLRNRDKWITGGRYDRNSRTTVYDRPLGAVVADEVHTISDPARGPTYETVLTQLRTELPNAQFVAISGTIPNAEDLATWLGAETVISNIRPTKLRMGVYDPKATRPYVRYDDGTEEVIGGSSNRQAALKMIVRDAKRSGERALVFVASKKRAEALADLLKKSGIKADYHHAGRSNRDKARVEEQYKSGKLDVLIATPTLAAGVNLPADVSVVYDTVRFDAETGKYVPLTNAEIKQMLGRAGRFGKEGRAILIPYMDRAELERTKRDPITPVDLEKMYIYKEPEPVQSHLDSAFSMTVLGLICRHTLDVDGICAEIANTYWGRTHSDDEIIGGVSQALAELIQNGHAILDESGVVRCTTLGKVASGMCIQPKTAKLMAVLSENVETLKGLSDVGRDVYVMAMLAQAEEADGLAPASKEFRQTWDNELSKWSEIRAMLPKEYDDISDDRFRMAIAMAEMMNLPDDDGSEFSPRKKWARDHDVYEGDLLQRIETARWLTYSLDRVSTACGVRSPYFTSLEPRLVDQGLWEEGDFWGLMRKLGYRDTSSDIANAYYSRLREAHSLMTLEAKEYKEVLPNKAALKGLRNALFPPKMHIPEIPEDWEDHMLVTPMERGKRMTWPPEPVAIPGWTAAAEAYFLKTIRSSDDGKEIFSKEAIDQIETKNKDFSKAVLSAETRIKEGRPEGPGEAALSKWWREYDGTPGAEFMLNRAIRRAVLFREFDETVEQSLHTSIDPSVFNQGAKAALEQEKKDSEVREADLKTYYAKVKKHHDVVSKSFGLGPVVDHRIARPKEGFRNNLYSTEGEGPFTCGAYIGIHEITPGEEGTFTGPYTEWLDRHMTSKGVKQYTKSVQDQLNKGEAASWRTINGTNGRNGIVLTVRSDLSPEQKAAEIVRQLRGPVSEYFDKRGMTWTSVATGNPELAATLAGYMHDKDMVVVGGEGLPAWGGPDEEAPQVEDSVALPWDRTLRSIKDLTEMKGADLASRGLSESNGSYRLCMTKGDPKALLRAPTTSIIGLKALANDEAKAKSVRNAIAGTPGTIICDIPKANSGLREIMLENAGRMVLTVKGTALSSEEKRFVQRMLDGGCAVIAVEGQIGYTPYLQAALGDRNLVAGVDNMFASHITNAIAKQKELERDISCLPCGDSYAHALGIRSSAPARYIPGTDPAAELTLTLEHMRYSPKKIAEFAKACGYDAVSAAGYASALPGYEAAHEAALKRLTDMAEYGIGIMTVFDPEYNLDWVTNSEDPSASVTFLGDRSLLKSEHKAAADGSDGLFDSDEDVLKLMEGDHPYSRAVGNYMQLITTDAFTGNGGILATGTHSTGARAANEAVYRTGGKLIRYIDIPIEDLITLGGPDSMLMHYLRDKSFKNPDDEDRYSLYLVGDNGVLDPARIYGVEHAEVGEGAEVNYTYEDGIGVKAFAQLCFELDKHRRDTIAQAKLAKKPIPTKMTFQDGNRTITLPMHPTYSYQDILMDSIALQKAKDNDRCIIVAPSDYSTDLSSEGVGWTPSRDMSELMTASCRHMVMAGSANQRHPERRFTGDMLVLPVSNDSTTFGGKDKANLWYRGANLRVFGDDEFAYTNENQDLRRSGREVSVNDWLGAAQPKAQEAEPAQEPVPEEPPEEPPAEEPAPDQPKTPQE